MIRPTEELPDEVPAPLGVIADELLPDDGPRFNRPVRAPGSIPFREGLAALGQHAYAKAATHFQRVLDKFPKSVLAASAEAYLAEIHLWKAVTPQSQADAIAQYRHLVVAYPADDNVPRAYWRIGDLYAGMGLYPEAHGAYSRWLSEGKPSPDTDRALLGSGINKLLWGKGAEAADDFDLLRRQTANEWYQQAASIGFADALALQGRHQEARALYEAAFRAWPGEVKRHTRSLLSFALTYAELGMVKQARWLYEQFYNLHPTHPRSGDILIRAGDTYLNEQRADRAVFFYRQVLAQFGNTEASDLAYLRLAQLGGESIRRDPEHRLAIQVKGLMDVTTALVFDEAEQEAIYRAVAIDRGDEVLGSEALFRLGEHYERADNVTEAIAAYRALRERQGAIAADRWPDAAVGRLKAILQPWIAAALQRQDDLGAVRLFQQAGPSPEQVCADAEILVGLADAYRRLGVSAEAVKLYQLSLRASDQDAIVSPALLGLGRAYTDQDDLAAARHVYQRYRLQFPLAAGRDEALTALIRLADKEGDRATVLRLSKLWLRDFPDSPKRATIMLTLAEAQLHAGEVDDALRLSAAVERLRPTVSNDAWLRHADVLATAGHPGEAAKRYQMVILSKPTADEDAWARVRLASVLRTLNRRADAAAILAPLRTRNVDPLVSRYSSMLERDLDLGGG